MPWSIPALNFPEKFIIAFWVSAIMLYFELYVGYETFLRAISSSNFENIRMQFLYHYLLKHFVLLVQPILYRDLQMSSCF